MCMETSNLTHTGSIRTLSDHALLEACHSAYSKVSLSVSGHSLWASLKFLILYFDVVVQVIG